MMCHCMYCRELTGKRNHVCKKCEEEAKKINKNKSKKTIDKTVNS